MAREIPEIVRAAAGLAATVLDEARKLPEALPGLPVRIIGLAMQQAMKIHQQYAGLVARGDELFTGLRGEDEPGLATFDEDDLPPAGSGFRESAFDRAGDLMGDTISDSEVAELPDDPEADAVVAAVEELAVVAVVEDAADQVEDALETLDELAGEAPPTDEILDELAIDEMVDAPLAGSPLTDAPVTEDAGALEAALLESGEQPPAGSGPAPAEDSAIAEGAGVAAVGTESPAPTDEPEGGSQLSSGSQAAAAAPVDGYDSFSIAQLRGRLRGYQLATVQDLLAYEEATRAREPYLRMLRNRLEKLEQQAVESSPLAPRG